MPVEPVSVCMIIINVTLVTTVEVVCNEIDGVPFVEIDIPGLETTSVDASVLGLLPAP